MAWAMHLVGVAAVLAAATLVHLATRRQPWRRTQLPAGPALGGAVALCGVAILAWSQVMMAATAIFVTLTMAMLALNVVPLAALLRPSGKAPRSSKDAQTVKEPVR